MAKKNVQIIRVEGTPEWMISFGDLLSCLLVFFILLLTFSSPDEGKMMDLLGEFTEEQMAPGDHQQGVLPGAAGTDKNIEVDPEKMAPVKLDNLLVTNQFIAFKNKITALGFKKNVNVNDVREGLRLILPLDEVFRTERGAVVSERGLEVVTAMANLVHSIGNELRVSISCPPEDGAAPRKRQFNQLAAVQALLSGKFKIPASQISYAANATAWQGSPIITFLITDKVDEKMISIDEYIKNFE